ncbi:unnamed protein product, partial [Closterium sp. NIES-54]
PVSLGGYGRTDPLLKQALLSQWTETTDDDCHEGVFRDRSSASKKLVAQLATSTNRRHAFLPWFHFNRCQLRH